MSIITWIQQHIGEIVTALGGIVLAARIIVKLTPTPKDDTLLDGFVSLLKHVGLHIESKK